MEQTETTQAKASQPFSTPIAILLSGVLIAGAIIYGLLYAPAKPQAGTNGDTSQGQQATGTVPAPTDTDHVRGSISDAQLVLVEYSDLECPYCSQFHPTVKKLLSDYGGKVAWIYRHFPLSQIHPDALPAAIASECVAQAKGNDAFWRFADSVFAKQDQIGDKLYHQLASAEGISTADFDACLTDKNVVAKVQTQFNEAVQAGARGTPFTVILNKKGEVVGSFPGAMPYAQAKAQLDALLK